jgi:3-hydroxybutyryl-CoA dehydrogenase
MTSLQTVGVVGAGVMGAGVAQALAQARLDVVLVDRTAEILADAERRIRDGVRFLRFLGGGSPQEDRAQILKRITYTAELAEVAPVDFLLENVTEDWAAKQAVYRQIDAVCRPECVFAANTSGIPITRIGGATGRPAKVLGMHFMNPVPLKPLVEVIRGHHTSDKTVELARALLARMGKEGVVVNDSPGFVTNRVLMLTINEAIFLVQERVATVEEIDRLFKGCFDHRMGPLETADLIGLDTILQSVEGLYASFGDSKYRPCPLLKRMVEAGLYGRKNGQGFYSYGSPTARV